MNINSNNSSGQSTVSSLVWKTFEHYGVYGIRFVLQMVLARILEPEHYGVVAIATIFIDLSNVFIQKGFAIALVRNKNLDDIDASSVFYLSELVSIILYFLLFVCSEPFATFYSILELKGLIRLMSLSLFFGAYSSILNSIIQRQMLFRMSFIIGITSVAISGAIGIFAAVKGMGVWALAYQHLSYSFLSMALMICGVRWYPKFVVKLDRVKPLFSFGWKVLLTSLIDELFVEYRSLVIGKVYDGSSLSFFNRGKQFPHILVYSINGAMQSVLLPVMSKVQDDKQAIKKIMHSAIVGSSFFIYPMLAMMAVTAPSFIPLLMTEKWSPSVPFVQIFCIFYATWPLTVTFYQAMFAMGKSNVVLYCEVLKKGLDLLTLILTLKFGPKMIALGAATASIFILPIYSILCRRLIGYSIFEQFRDVVPNIIGIILMVSAVYSVSLFHLSSILTFAVQIVVGVFVYAFYGFLFRLEGLNILIKRIKQRIQKKGQV